MRCVVTFHSSDMSESRIIEGLKSVMHCSRQVLTHPCDAPAREEPESIKEWAKFLLMYDSRKFGYRNLISYEISDEYLNHLTDEDHVKALGYLRNAPVSCKKSAWL